MNLVANENNTFAADENNTLVGIETPDPSQVYTKDQVDGLFQRKQDNNLETTVKTVVGGINEINSIAKGANQAVAYTDYEEMVETLNELDGDAFRVGQNIYIETLEVPDIWIRAIEAVSVPYTYVDDETIINALITVGYIQCGHYKISMLETQKVDLTQYYTKLETDGLLTPIREDIQELQTDVSDLESGKQDKATTGTFTLAVASWSNNQQTVNVSGVTATNTVIVSPSPSDISKYSASGIRCIAQASGTLTFECDTVPTEAISVGVVIL